MISQPRQTAPVPAAAAEELWNRFHDELYRFVRARVPAEVEAQDILQTTYLRALQHLGAGELPHNPRAWLYQISRNLIVDTHRVLARGRTANEALVAEAPELGVGAGPGEEDLHELESSAFALMAKALPIFIHGLPEPYKSALHATEIEGLTQAEAAGRAGITVSGMKSRVQRGRRLLRQALERCCHFELDRRGHMISCTPHPQPVCCAPPA
jgi:RNA polymerase sigma-70 factor, ECF subfamily